MEQPVHKEVLHGYTIEIVPDCEAPNPYTDWDCVSTLLTWHRDYCWHKDGKKEFGTPDDFMTWARKNKAIVIPVYLFDHSGTTIRATENGNPFSCPWDSGQVGVVYVTREKAIEEFAGKRKALTKAVIKKVKECMIAEIKSLDDCMTGNVYGYKITNPSGAMEDSCWGFVGDYEYCLEEARGTVGYRVEAEKTAQDLADQQYMDEMCANEIYA